MLTQADILFIISLVFALLLVFLHAGSRKKSGYLVLGFAIATFDIIMLSVLLP